MDLLIRIYSFGFSTGNQPLDPTGNGGGFVFDCRGLYNPGRVDELRNQTGRDFAVCSLLDNESDVAGFLDHTYELIINIATTYKMRAFTDLSAAFGCTGGRHRSVYCAEHIANRLRTAGYKVRVVHWQMERVESRFATRRAMVLAAGLGTRLQPITNTIPKALVTAHGKSMLDWTLESLERVNCREITINSHHHADQIESWIEEKRSQLNSTILHYSFEPEILGTGGGIRQAARWLHSPTPVLIHNADIWSDFDWEVLYTLHRKEDLASLVVQKRQSSSYLLVDEEQRVCGLETKGIRRIVATPHGELSQFGFCGVHLVSTTLLEQIHTLKHASIIESYLEWIANGATVRAITLAGNWFDMGSPEKLEQLSHFLQTKMNS
ncbi:MAG: sugar phosphate nucleotidyltransferase [bacterium]|nr:sugar phosphate nucleotidyltransferase [bacterium]